MPHGRLGQFFLTISHFSPITFFLMVKLVGFQTESARKRLSPISVPGYCILIENDI